MRIYEARRAFPLCHLFLLLTFICLAVPEAQADKTLRGRLKPKSTSVSQAGLGAENGLRFDTIPVESQTAIRLSGYDKPLNSRKESLFVSNKLPCEIVGLKIRLSYTDMSDRPLHESVMEIRADIPPGATRRIEFPSWDKQNSFYYHAGRQPRVANVTPYRVKCEVISYITISAPTGD